MDKKYTFCRICEPCCGFVAELENGRIVRYYAEREHPISKGYSCVKGRQMPGIQHHPKRIKFPLKRRNGEFERISWEQAIEEIGSKLVELKDNYGPHSIGAYIGNVLAFSYSAVLYCGAFMKFIGTRNMYGTGSQDCNNKFAHSLRFYGSPLTIVSPDFDAVDCLLAFGTNPLAAHFTFANFPNPLARLKEMEKRGCKIAWINPRRIEAAKAAGEHYFIRPNTDHYLVFGMINYVLENGLEDKEFIRTYSKGIDRLRGVAREFGSDLDRIEGITGVPKEHVIRLTNDFLEASKKGGAAAYGRLGTDRGPFGTLSAWAIDTLNFITGNIDKRGNYYSPGFLNIAASSQMESVASGEQPKSRIGGFSPVMGSLPAATMADEILTPGEGQIKAMIVLAGDPLVSCPNTRKLEKALRDLELLVSLDIFMNDTGTIANYILPTTTFLEREEFSFFTSCFNSMTFVHYSPAVVARDGEQKDEWEIFNLLGQKVGIPTLGEQPLEVLRMLFPGKDEQQKLEQLLKSEKGIFLNDKKKVPFNTLLPDGIKHPDRLIPLVPDDYLPEFQKLRRWAISRDEDYPFSMISGRQVETINSWLHASGGTNYCYMNPEDAKQLGIEDSEVVRVSTRIGHIDIPAKLTHDLMRGVVWIPHGWGRTVETVPEMAVEKRGVNVNLITDDDWRKLETLGGMVLLDGIKVGLERI